MGTMKSQRFISFLLCTILLLFLVGCSSGPGNQGTENPGQQNEEPVDGDNPLLPQKPKINLAEYNGGYFSVLLPEGWQIQTMGKYTTFGFRAWDPQNPDYEVFYYGILGPLNKSNDAKNGWGDYIGNMGYSNAALYYDAPAVDENSASSVFYTFDLLQALSNKYSLGFSFPALDEFMPMKSIPVQTAYASVSSHEAMVFGGVRGSNGGACGGMFMASMWKTNPYFVNGVDMMPTSALNVFGVIAPAEDFKNVEEALTQAVFSLRFTEEYIREGIAYSTAVGEAAMADNAARWAVFDEANRKWSAYFRGGSTSGGSSTLNEIDDILDDIQGILDDLK